ncbi:hypothetical protein H9645_02380 [Luteimonas sp. Sa2BVA3]|uniref:Lipoprotein n=1 Tax=Luteimonas colneyensis TaxID=2762230 RepID=A0ABR8UFR2_9GAMM|nr:hypothetical protein [Luteimonas colneyensis]MBD7986874.1 hypothetical protein [Luteimonas colneyensis]
MATSMWNLVVAGVAAGLLAACARGEPAPSRQTGADGVVDDAARAARTHRHAARPDEPSARTALMYRPGPMRAVAAAMRATQRRAQAAAGAKGGAAARPGRVRGS